MVVVEAGGDAVGLFLVPGALREWLQRRRTTRRDRLGWSLRPAADDSGWTLTKTVVGGARQVQVSLRQSPAGTRVTRQLRDLAFLADPSREPRPDVRDVVVVHRPQRVDAGEVLLLLRPPGMRCSAVVVEWTADEGDPRSIALDPTGS